MRAQSKKIEAKQVDEAPVAPSDSMPEEHMLPVDYQPASAFEMAAQPGIEAGKMTELFSPAILWDSKPALPVPFTCRLHNHQNECKPGRRGFQESKIEETLA